MADLSDKYEYDKQEVVPIDSKKIFNKSNAILVKK